MIIEEIAKTVRNRQRDFLCSTEQQPESEPEIYVYIDHVTFMKMVKEFSGTTGPAEFELLHDGKIGGAPVYRTAAPESHGYKVYLVSKVK